MTIFFDLHTIPSFYKIKTLLVFQPNDQNPPRNTQAFDRNLPRKFDKKFSAKKQLGFLEKDFVGFNQKGGGELTIFLFASIFLFLFLKVSNSKNCNFRER